MKKIKINGKKSTETGNHPSHFLLNMNYCMSFHKWFVKLQWWDPITENPSHISS